MESKIARDPEKPSKAVRRIGFIFKCYYNETLPKLRKATTGALVRGFVGVVLTVGYARISGVLTLNPTHRTRLSQYGDFVSDVLVLRKLSSDGVYWARNGMLVSLGLNLIVQAVVVFLFKQPLTELGLILFLVKPAADMIRVVSCFVGIAIFETLDVFGYTLAYTSLLAEHRSLMPRSQRDRSLVLQRFPVSPETARS